MLGSFSKAFLQRLTRVTINIDLGEDAQWGPDRSSGAFQGLLMLLGVVWDQSHRLENLTINLSGSMAGHRGIDICEYLFSLFYPLKKVANIPNVVIKRYLDDENVTPTERANLEYDLEAYLQMLKRDNVTTPEAEGLSLFYLKCPGDVRYDHGTATLLFSAFVRWWLLAKQGCTLEKFQELPQGTSSTYFRRLKRTWDVRSWRSLPLEPTQEECAEEPNVLADPVAEELGWIPPGYEY
ncbi:hypothetical protein MMC30_004607 [Trapelia coarctata]|nr:hypothetical protein [Trapelia coarctata]